MQFDGGILHSQRSYLILPRAFDQSSNPFRDSSRDWFVRNISRRDLCRMRLSSLSGRSSLSPIRKRPLGVFRRKYRRCENATQFGRRRLRAKHKVNPSDKKWYRFQQCRSTNCSVSPFRQEPWTLWCFDFTNDGWIIHTIL